MRLTTCLALPVVAALALGTSAAADMGYAPTTTQTSTHHHAKAGSKHANAKSAKAKSHKKHKKHAKHSKSGHGKSAKG